MTAAENSAPRRASDPPETTASPPLGRAALERIRHILFSEKFAEIEGRCQALYTQLATLQDRLTQRVEATEESLRSDVRELAQKIAAQAGRHDRLCADTRSALGELDQRIHAASDALRVDLSKLTERTEQRLVDVDAASSMRYQRLEEAQRQLERQADHLTRATAAATQRLDEAKADRTTLAALLRGLADQIDDDPEAPRTGPRNDR